MCGIAGQARADQGGVEEALLHRMCAALEHRGPDSRGVYVEAGVGLGIQRLRVIDLNTGDQPLFSEDGTVVVVLNGEIYNFRELRSELVRSGHRFATKGDTESIVHAYEEHGLGFVERLQGMFALALWDRRRRRLVLARDRPGKKPLFYCERDGVLSFASELPALLQDANVEHDLDYRALDAYLAYRYVPAPLSAFRAVRKLPPGSTLVFEDGCVTIEKYWQLDFSRKRPDEPRAQTLEALRDQLARAVRKRMISDVPLGAFLSGGVDSAAVVALMAQQSSVPVKTFSIGFRNSELDELPLARQVAERFGTDHHELVVEPSAIESLPTIVGHHGEPFADATSIPSLYLAEMARRHVTVALNGDGGDELFAGYTRYVANAVAGNVDRLPPRLRGAISVAAMALPPSGRVNSLRSRLRRLGETLPMNPLSRYTHYMTALQGLRRERLYTDDFRALVEPSVVPEILGEPWRASSANCLVDRMLDVDTQSYLPDDLLAKVDIATMAHSLEARSPFLDHEVMEFAASLPQALKLHYGAKKVGLREAMRGYVPDAILDAPKRGFQPPLADWLRGELRELAGDALLDGTARGRGFFRTEEVQRLLREHGARTHDHSQGIWTLLVFELWHRQVVDARSASPSPIAV